MGNRPRAVECFRGRHRGGCNFTSFLRLSGPFFHAAKWALSTLRLAPPWRESPEAPLDRSKSGRENGRQNGFRGGGGVFQNGQKMAGKVAGQLKFGDCHPYRNNYKRKKKIPGSRIFLSIELRKRKRKKISRILFFFVNVSCCCGLCIPNLIITKANAKENLGYLFAFPWRKRKQNKTSRFSFVVISVRMVRGH